LRVSNVIVGLIMLILYIALFIPLILPHLNLMFIDWVNNSGDMFIQQYCTQRQVLNTTSNSFDTIVECTQYDFRPMIVFIYQLLVYFAIPLLLIFQLFRRRW
jgi:4-amino-4-deoxy-L-arabinose transferase-like glycosyltransferase